jgi:glycosyltransferase involved in cell wall biosynthesis
MKILVHDYAGHPFQVHLSRQMAVRGHDVTHAYFADDPGPKGVLQRLPGDPPGLRFVGISIGRAYDKGSLLARHVNDLEYGRRAAEMITRLRPDVVISGNTPTESQTAIVQASKTVKAAVVHWLQDFYSVAATKLLRKRLGPVGGAIGLYYQYLERRQLRASDAVVIITDDFRPLASAWAGSDDRIHTIENWASLDDIPVLPKDNAWSRQHGMAQTFSFLYSGTLGLKNSPQFLVKLAQDCGPAAAVAVVGQGVGIKQLEAAKAEHRLDTLTLLPLQPSERFPEVLATGDVLIALVEADAGSFSVPSKVQSYLCAGRPILLAAPADNLAARVVAREAAGIVVGPYDQDGFVAAAIRLRDDPALRERMGANARAYAERTFHIMTIVDRFEEVVHAALKRSRPLQDAAIFSKRQKLGEAETYS